MKPRQRFIDVSNYSGSVMLWFAKLRYHIAAVYILFSDGTTFPNASHPYRAGEALLWRHARDRGLERGAIHYLRPNESGKAQASHFLSLLHQAGGWGPYAKAIIDVENTMGMGAYQVLACANEFEQTVIAGGFAKENVLLYSAHWFWNMIGNPTTVPEPLAHASQWLALYDDPKIHNPSSLSGMKSKVVAQQYAGSVPLRGVSRNIDLDICLA